MCWFRARAVLRRVAETVSDGLRAKVEDSAYGRELVRRKVVGRGSLNACRKASHSDSGMMPWAYGVFGAVSTHIRGSCELSGALG